MALCFSTLAGCTASKVPFEFTPAYVPQDDVPAPWNNVAVSVVDERSDRTVDAVLTPAVDRAVGEGLAAELRTSGLAAEATWGQHPADAPVADQLSQGIDAHLVATLQDLRWEIVNYAELQATAFAVGLFAGVIGIAIMAATETDVDGHARMAVHMTDLRSETSFSKIYSGHCEKAWPTLESDQPETKARMTVCAFELAIRGLRADLEGFAAELQTPPAHAVEVGEDNAPR